MKRFRNDFVAILGILVAVAIFFWPIAGGKLPVPADTLVGLYHPWRDLYANEYPRGIPFKNSLITDPIRQQIPWRKVVIDQWKAGRIPSWNPFNFAGTSLVGNIQAAAFYPANVLFFFLDFAWAWTTLIVLQPMLAGLFLYIYLRNLRTSILASFFGAITWSFSGFMTSWLTWGTMIHVVLWLPLILLAIDKAKEARLGWSVILTFALIVQFFAGHAQLSLYVLMLASVYALWRRVRIFWIALILSGIITSIQWIPFVRSVVESSRVEGVSNWTVEGWFLPWQNLVQFVAPDFFGNPTTGNYWGIWNYGEFIGYIGIVGILFAIAALFYSLSSVEVRFWGIVLAIALLFLLPTPLAKLPYLLNIPIVSNLQPTRLMMIVDFSLIMLAAIGFDQWLRKGRRFWHPLLVTGGTLGVLWILAVSFSLSVSTRNLILPSAIFIAAAITFMIRLPRIVSIVLIALSIFDLFRFGWKFTPFTSAEYFFPQTASIDFLRSYVEESPPFRVVSADPRLFPANALSYYGIDSVDGYDPIYFGRYEEFMAALNRGRPDISPPFGFNRILAVTNVESPLLRFMNVDFVASLTDISDPNFQKVFQEGETRIYKLLSTTERAYFVQGVKIASSKEDIIQNLYLLEFPFQYAIVEEPVSVETIPGMWKADTVVINESTPNTLIVETHDAPQRFLMVTNAYDDKWSAEIDGNKTKIYRTNYIFQGVIVPAGRHTVRLQYR